MNYDIIEKELELQMDQLTEKQNECLKLQSLTRNTDEKKLYANKAMKYAVEKTQVRSDLLMVRQKRQKELQANLSHQ